MARSRWTRSSTLVTLVVLVGFAALSAWADTATPGKRYQDLLREFETASQKTPEEAHQGCARDEKAYLAIDRDLLQPWRAAWMQARGDRFARLTSAQFKTIDLATQPPSAWRSQQGIDEFRQAYGEAMLTRDAGLSALATYLSRFKKIEDVTFDTVRLATQANGTEAYFETRFDLRGLTAAGRQNDRATFFLKAIRDGGKWKLASLHAKQLDSLRAARPLFENVTASSGIAAAPVLLRTEAIRRGGYALAVGNLFGALGPPDLLVATRDELTLWKNDGKGRFQAVKNLPLNREKLVKTAVIADFDNDGRGDILLTKFTPGNQAEDLAVYRNEGAGKFTKLASPLKGRIPSEYAMPAAVADFNRDGMLDFYVGFPGNRDFTFIRQASNASHAPKTSQGIFLNQGMHEGKLSFEDKTKAAGLFQPETPGKALFPHSALAYDFNGDHRADVVVIDDRGNLSPLYKNNGDGTFTQVAESIGVGNSSVGMGAAVASLQADGRLDIVMTSIDFAAAARWSACVGEAGGPMNGGGVRAFKNRGEGKFTEITKATGLEWAGEGVGGAEFIDYNSDGYPDLMVSNGLWSGTSRDAALASYFVRPDLHVGGESLMPADTSRSKVMEVLAAGRTADGGRPSMGGFQRKRLFRNNQDGTFTEIGYLAGVDSTADGYIVARADVDGDGKMDLLLRNADPGTKDFQFPVVEIFRNRAESGQALFISLQGSPESGSSRDAVLAEVTVKVGGMQQYQTLLMNNGAAQSEKILAFGLGSAKKADEVDVLWPSGQRQTLRDVPAGRLELQEKPSSQKPIAIAR